MILNFDSFLFPRATHRGDAEKCDFLIVKDTNELGPQVQKVLKEVASWDYESLCSHLP